MAGSRRKFITFEEIENIKNAGLRVFPIYQDGGYQLSYFQDLKQGTVDAHTCLLYTSDAADDLLCVDLGDCRIIKKKTDAVGSLRHIKVTYIGLV